MNTNFSLTHCDGKTTKACGWSIIEEDERRREQSYPYVRMEGYVTICGEKLDLTHISVEEETYCVRSASYICEEDITTYEVVGIGKRCLTHKIDLYRIAYDGPCGFDGDEETVIFAKGVRAHIVMGEQEGRDGVRTRTGKAFVEKGQEWNVEVGMYFKYRETYFRIRSVTGLDMCDVLPMFSFEEAKCV